MSAKSSLHGAALHAGSSISPLIWIEISEKGAEYRRGEMMGAKTGTGSGRRYASTAVRSRFSTAAGS